MKGGSGWGHTVGVLKNQAGPGPLEPGLVTWVLSRAERGARVWGMVPGRAGCVGCPCGGGCGCGVGLLFEIWIVDASIFQTRS